jgi:hypothetical protein
MTRARRPRRIGLRSLADPYARRFVNYLLKHCLYGSVGGAVLGALLLWRDISGLGTMIFASPDRELFLLLLFFGLFITFGSIGMAVGVMQLGEERTEPGSLPSQHHPLEVGRAPLPAGPVQLRVKVFFFRVAEAEIGDQRPGLGHGQDVADARWL